MNELELLSKQLAREKDARKEAEKIAEEKSRVLYHANNELKRIAEDLADKEKRTRAILESSADSILILNADYKVIIFNSAACELFCYSSDELLNKNIMDLIVVINPKKNETIENIFDHSQHNTLFELTALTKNKINLPIEVAISKIKSAQDTLIICGIRNIFLRKQSEQLLAIRHQIVRILASYSTLDDVTSKILQIICETMQLEVGALWKVDQINKILRCIDVWSINNTEVKEFANVTRNKFSPKCGEGLPGRVWQNKTVSWIEDATKDDNFPRLKYALDAGLHSAFAFPILYENEVLAVIEFFMNKLYPFSDQIINVLDDITHLIGIFIEREEAQKRLTTLSRMAGMAEVASSVLHNIGNTLNSINTSVEILNEKTNHSKMDQLTSMVELLNQHKDDIGIFLTQDQQGKHTLEFLSLLVKEWNNEKKYLSDEVTTLKKNTDHVKNIITVQQTLSQSAGFTEKLSIPELLDDAITINKIALERINLEIIREFTPIKPIVADKVKLFQILVNLIKNAIESLIESGKKNPQLILRLSLKDDLNLMIQIKDNGVGILPQNITKIFSHGFTTKKNGHGFGLHNSAIFAKEMGGSLFAESDGLNLGATFTLILPYQYQIRNGNLS